MPKPPWFVHILLSISNVFFSFRSFGGFLSWNTCTRDFGGCLCLIFQALLKYYFLKVTHVRPAQLKALYHTTPSLLFSLSPYFTSFPTQFTIHNYFYVYKDFIYPPSKCKLPENNDHLRPVLQNWVIFISTQILQPQIHLLSTLVLIFNMLSIISSCHNQIFKWFTILCSNRI